MKKRESGFFKTASYICMVFVIALGLMTIVGTGGGGGGGGGGDDAGDDAGSTTYDYTTTVTTVASQDVDASSGGTIEVTDSSSYIQGVKLTIPSAALPSSTTITIGEVNNPPELPSGLNYVGVPIDLGPDGMIFDSPLTIEIPYHDEDLSDAGISDDTALKLYYYDESSSTWVEATIISIDTANNKITAEITHFSYYAVTGLGGKPPEDLGTPQPGDLLYKLSLPLESHAAGWRPGHVGIYTGEKKYLGTGLASQHVKDFEMYNVVEALWGDIQYSYYNIPNVTETDEDSLDAFSGSSVYMGAREPADVTLTLQQREDIVAYVEAQVGKPYTKAQTAGVLFGMLSGSLVKGQFGSFNCVGLAEKAYEEAGVNEGEGLVSWWQEEVGIIGKLLAALTPAEQYNATKPAGGANPYPTIEWATLTPDSGTECTSVLAEISVSHTYDLSYIDSVTYVTDDGYTNPGLYINDEGLQGDSAAGDGIYSTQAPMGGDASMGTVGLNFTVTDLYGKTDSTRLVYTYIGTCLTSSSLKSTDEIKSLQWFHN